MGFESDYYFRGLQAPNTPTGPYNRIVAAIDNSGRGKDETALTIVAELNGYVFLLALWASRGGFEPETLVALAKLLVRFRVNECLIESNFGDGMFTVIFQPVLERAWRDANKGKPEGEYGGTTLTEVKVSNLLQKERRILSILEPVTQAHRLVVNQEVIEWDLKSLQEIDGEDGRHRYSLFHQFTHLTRERECLTHEDRLDSLATAVGAFGDVLGVDPGLMASRKVEDALDEEWEKLFGPDVEEDDEGILRGKSKQGQRPSAAGVQPR